MIYLLAGDETRRIEYLKLLKDFQGEVKVFDVQNLNDEENEFWSCLVNIKLFQDPELLVLKGGEKLKDSELKEILKYKDKNIVIDFEDKDLKLSKKLKEISEEGIVFISISDNKFSERRVGFISSSLGISKEEAEELLMAIGTDLYRIENEVEKIKSFLGEDKKYSFESIEGLLISEYSNEFKMAEDIFDGKKASKIKDGAALFYLLIKMLKLALKINLVKDKLTNIKGYNDFVKNIYPQIKDFVKDHPFFIFKNIKRSLLKGEKEIEKKLSQAMKIESEIRSGRREEQGGYELFISSFGH